MKPAAEEREPDDRPEQQSGISPISSPAWGPSVNLILGAWLLSTPWTFEYGHAGLLWSDLIAGFIIVFLGGVSLASRAAWPRWGTAFAGAWLLFSPLIFWTQSAAAYAVDTMIGVLVIVSSVIIPGAPGTEESPGPEVPPGWSYNPSNWVQRSPVIAMALIGFFIARYLASFQLGHIRTVWDPFFVDGTRKVLESDVSKAFPISDAGLGAISYLLEALTGFMGGTARWRTMPWMVLFFGFLVVPLGVVSIVLIILQPLAVGAWCTLCLATAVAMLVMISPAADEVVATVQFLSQARRSGQSLWSAFWRGGTLPSLESIPSRSARGGWWSQFAHASGLTQVPWTLAVASAIGVWLMLTPVVFGLKGFAANNHYLAGALVVTFTVIAWGEITRMVRWIGVLLGVWFAAATWFIAGQPDIARWSDVIAGLALIALSIPKGRMQERFGTFDRWIV